MSMHLADSFIKEKKTNGAKIQYVNTMIISDEDLFIIYKNTKFVENGAIFSFKFIKSNDVLFQSN